MRFQTPMPLTDARLPGVTPGVVYRLLDTEGTPWYVGSTDNLTRRIKEHRRSKQREWWFARVVSVDYVQVSLRQQYKLEQQLIHDLHPVGNCKWCVQKKQETL